jgi:hypothetical protein
MTDATEWHRYVQADLSTAPVEDSPTDADRTIGVTVVLSLAVGSIISILVLSYYAAEMIFGLPFFE